MIPSVIFFPVKDNAMKTRTIVHIVHTYFEERKNILITVLNDQVADYVDQLLWRWPEESFLPHTISSEFINSPINITKDPKNWNNAKILCNLCPTTITISNEFEVICELMDETYPEKMQHSLQKKEEYKKWGFSVRDYVCNT